MNYLLIVKTLGHNECIYLIGEGTHEAVYRDRDLLAEAIGERQAFNAGVPYADEDDWDDNYAPEEIDLDTLGEDIDLDDIDWYGVFRANTLGGIDAAVTP